MRLASNLKVRNAAYSRIIAVVCGIASIVAGRPTLADIPGACCFSDGSCETFVNSADCEADGGSFAAGTTCDKAACRIVSPVCDKALAFEACPTEIVVETTDPHGAIFELPSFPSVRGCGVSIAMIPSLGDVLTVGENTITLLATDEFGESAVCQFTVVVRLIDQSGPIMKHRMKGTSYGGTTAGGCGTTDDIAQSILVTNLCGSCPPFALAAATAGIAGIRRNNRKLLRNR